MEPTTEDKPKAKKNGAAKLAKAAKGAVRELKKAKPKDGWDPQKAAKQIVKKYKAWQRATGELHEVSKVARERVGGAEASFRESVEASLPVTGSTEEKVADATEQLQRVQVKWQDWQEAMFQGIEERKGAKDKRAKAAKALERSVEETRQMALFEDGDDE